MFGRHPNLRCYFFIELLMPLSQFSLINPSCKLLIWYSFTDLQYVTAQIIIRTINNFFLRIWTEFIRVREDTQRQICSNTIFLTFESRHSLISIVTAQSVDRIRDQFTAAAPRRADRVCGPPSLLPSGHRGSFHGLKRRWREADHSPPYISQDKNAWIYTSAPIYLFMAC
jgi:hypothetical protein